MTALIDRAHSMATAAHEGQTDKAGAPYIDHPRRVSIRVCRYAPDELTEAAQAVAWLHDVVEDTPITLQELTEHFPPTIVAAVDALTHRAHETRENYYQRVATNTLARAVKQADIDDNTDPQRLQLLDEHTRHRLETKYAQARAALAVGLNRPRFSAASMRGAALG